MKLNETVDMLQKKVQSLESGMEQVSTNTQYAANQVSQQEADTKGKLEPERTKINGIIPSSNAQWSLSLTPKGLSIETDIISLPGLYDILLSGISHFDLAAGTCTDEQSTESRKLENSTLLRNTPLWKSHMKTHPLYSAWEIETPKETVPTTTSARNNKTAPIEFDANLYTEEVLIYMISVFEECFLCLPSYHPTLSIAERYSAGVLDPLLANCVFAWTSRHTAIYHNLFPGKDPNLVGHNFFLKAKELIKDRFMYSSEDTMLSLIVMYIYTIGIPSKDKASVESEAYLYLGLAIRMCLDMKMNVESNSGDIYERERNRRLFWVLYFLETLSSIHSDKSFTLPQNVTVGFPTLMEHEKSGETRYRVEFIIQRFKITRIYRNIINQTTEEKPLLSQISSIDKELQRWYADLPSYFKYETGDVQKRNWNSSSFREQACIKLNFEYNFQLCQLYSIFLAKEARTSPIEMLAHTVCLTATQNTVELLECWVQLNQTWCHFSFENLMATTMIYSHVLTTGDDQEKKTVQRNMEKIASMLRASPIKGHKYVLMILNKIDTSLNGEEQQALAQNLPLANAPTAAQQVQQFSNVAYWPTLLDFGTALNSPDILQQNQFFFDPQFAVLDNNNPSISPVVYPPPPPSFDQEGGSYY
jgi:hypothetical protein